jgi:hypothetical protein
MSIVGRGVVGLFLLTSLSHAQAPQCTLSSPGTGASLYNLSASSGTPIPQNPPERFVFKNNTPLLVRLTDINPFAFQCSVSTSSQSFQETALSSFLGIIGGVANVGASTSSSPKAQPPSVGAAPRQRTVNSVSQPVIAQSPCVNQYLDQIHNGQVVQLSNRRDAINAALQATLQAEQQSVQSFAQAVVLLRNQTSCATTVQDATNLASQQPFSISVVSGSLPLDQAIDQLANQAQSVLSQLTDGMDAACKQSLQADINEDSAFLSALVHGTTAIPAVADQWRTQLNQLNSVNSQLASARASVQAVLQNRQNFTIDTPLSGDQLDVKVAASCSPVAVLQVAPSSPPAAAGGALATQSQVPGAKPAPTAANTWSQDFKFGPGPRFILSGGLVVSPLSQIIYSTSSNPAGGTPANIIIKQQESSTRILPIAMLSGRIWDQLPFKAGYRFIPNYLSVGVTAKSTGTTGTNIEYLLGLSWAFAERQLFITAGAYAGGQHRLGGGLTAGETTSLSSANLPISLTTVWKPGISITWAPGGK